MEIIKNNRKIFISHATEDKQFVRILFNKLLNEGFTPWIDEESLSPGQRWEDVIMQSIQESRLVIACFSKISASKAGYIQKELRIALNEIEKKPQGVIYFLPVFIDDQLAELPSLKVGTIQLRDYHATRCLNEKDIDRLIVQINKEIYQDKDITVEFDKTDAYPKNWISGKIKGTLLFFFEEKCFTESGNGIDNGKISKLIVWEERLNLQKRILVNYDRGWDITPHQVDSTVIPYYKKLISIIENR